MLVDVAEDRFAPSPLFDRRFSGVDRQLLADRQVRFAGYMQPHPLENKIHIKVPLATAVHLAAAP